MDKHTKRKTYVYADWRNALYHKDKHDTSAVSYKKLFSGTQSLSIFTNSHVMTPEATQQIIKAYDTAMNTCWDQDAKICYLSADNTKLRAALKEVSSRERTLLAAVEHMCEKLKNMPAIAASVVEDTDETIKILAEENWKLHTRLNEANLQERKEKTCQ